MDESKLVIFVGAGVSMNSGLPSWMSLVKKMQSALKIDKPEIDNEDMLRIPQILSTQNAPKYKELLKKFIKNDKESNSLDDLIVKLEPDHIITTNYDHLLENVPSQYIIKNYTVVYNDKTFIDNGNDGNHFLIKMHGDIRDINSIVLKESDYLNYSNTHILISNFIKSLLATHVFLFVGYSLKDTNLKLILSWINYLYKQLHNEKNGNNKSEGRLPTNILLADQVLYSKNQDIQYFKSNNIEIVNLKELPESFKVCERNCPDLDSKGRLPFCFLKGLQDGLFTEHSVNSFKCFYGLNYIPTDEIMFIFKIKEMKRLSKNIIGIDPQSYKIVYKLVNNKENIGNLVKKLLSKTNIKKIENIEPIDDKYKYFNINSLNKDMISCYLQLDDYESLRRLSKTKNIKNSGSSNELYLRYLLHDNGFYEAYMKYSSSLNKENYVKFAIASINLMITKKSLANSFDNFFLQQTKVQNELTKSLRVICNRDLYFHRINKTTIADILSDQNNQYLGNKIKWSSIKDNQFGELSPFQSEIYNIYWYIMLNRLCIIHSNVYWGKLFEPYLTLILITYKKKSQFSLIENVKRDYKLNNVDVDIISKFLNTQFVENSLRDNHIKYLKYENKNFIVTQFINLCKFFPQFCYDEIERAIRNDLLLLTHTKLTPKESLKCIISFTSLIKHDFFKRDYKSLIYFFNFCVDFITLNPNKKLTTLDFYIFNQLSDLNLYTKIVGNGTLSPNPNLRKWCRRCLATFNIKREKIANFVNPVKDSIYSFIFLDAIKSKLLKEKIIKTIIKNLICSSSVWELRYLISSYSSQNILNYIFHKLIDNIIKEWNPNHKKSQPDKTQEKINLLIFLLTTHIRYQKRSLYKIMNKSKVLKFLSSPNTFDYSNVDIYNPSWQALILSNVRDFSNRYTKILNKHRKEIKINKPEGALPQIIKDRALEAKYMLKIN